MPLGAMTMDGGVPGFSAAKSTDIPTRLKELEQEITQLQTAVQQGKASPQELIDKKKEYEALRQKQEMYARSQEAIKQQAIKMGMNQLTGGKGFDITGMGQGGMGQSGGPKGLGGGQGVAAMSAVGGGLAGLAAGHQNYLTDPNMTNKRDDFGTKYPDLRAHVGGAMLGATLGYFGGPVGAALAGPAVTLAHKAAEPTTRFMINFGDKWGGAGGALMTDPIGTVSSGKYSLGQLGKGFLLGPFSKLIK